MRSLSQSAITVSSTLSHLGAQLFHFVFERQAFRPAACRAAFAGLRPALAGRRRGAVATRLSASAMRASASTRSDWASLTTSSSLGEGGAEFRQRRRRVGAALVGVLEAGRSACGSAFSRNSERLRLDLERIAAARPCRCCSCRSAPCRRRRTARGALPRRASRAASSCVDLSAQFAVAHAQLLGEVGAFLFQFEDAAAELRLRVLEFADHLQVAVALALDAAQLVLLAIDVAELVGRGGGAAPRRSSRGAGWTSANSARSWSLSARNSAMVIGRRRFNALFGEAHGAAPHRGHDASAPTARPISRPSTKYMMFSMTITQLRHRQLPGPGSTRARYVGSNGRAPAIASQCRQPYRKTGRGHDEPAGKLERPLSFALPR